MDSKHAIENVVLLGSGRVGSIFAKSIVRQGLNLIEIHNRSNHSTGQLRKELEAIPGWRGLQAQLNPDLYIIAVPDDEIPAVMETFTFRGDAIVVHTSGSVSINVLNKGIENYGIFYPLQTFVSGREISLREVPICIEASNNTTQKILTEFAGKFSGSVYQLNSEQRRVAHLAAVIAGNFSNALYDIAFELLEEKGLPRELIKPLIKETAERIDSFEPAKVQTGPASRGDMNIILKHLELLSDKDNTRKLYELMSKLILKKHTGKDAEL